jgi:hypothetical protein
MKFNLTTTKASNSFDFASRRKTFAQLLTISTLSIGALSAMIVPAKAISLAEGQVAWTGEVDNFLSLVNPIPGDTIDVTINNTGMGAMVTSATGPFFTTPGLFDQRTPAVTGVDGSGVYPINSAAATFLYVSGDSSNYVYELVSNLDFAFINGVTLTVVGGTKFRGDLNPGQAANLSTNNGTGSFYTEGGVRTDVTALSFTLNDIGGGKTAGYSILASTTATAVPEPFTIVGTLVGGTVAMRMRKKLAQASQD